MAGFVAGAFFFHLSPEGRGRVSEANEGEGVRKPRFFSDVRTPSPQPSPLWGEGVHMRKPGSRDGWKAHRVACVAKAAASLAANWRYISLAFERSTGWPRLPSLPVSAASTS